MKVLKAYAVGWDDSGWGEHMCYTFARVAKKTRLPAAKVRIAARSLTRKGLMEYTKGLISMQTDMLAGSGYCVTKQGAELAGVEV